jgi:LmbE family N-acetylglucosaminyl deacetylase
VREVWVSGGLAPNHYVDVTDTFGRKIAALRAHESQTGHMGQLEEFLRGRLAQLAAQGGLPDGRLAEAFQVLDSA